MFHNLGHKNKTERLKLQKVDLKIKKVNGYLRSDTN